MLQTVLVMHLFSSLVLRPRMLTNSCLARPRKTTGSAASAPYFWSHVGIPCQKVIARVTVEPAFWVVDFHQGRCVVQGPYWCTAHCPTRGLGGTHRCQCWPCHLRGCVGATVRCPRLRVVCVGPESRFTQQTRIRDLCTAFPRSGTSTLEPQPGCKPSRLGDVAFTGTPVRSRPRCVGCTHPLFFRVNVQAQQRPTFHGCASHGECGTGSGWFHGWYLNRLVSVDPCRARVELAHPCTVPRGADGRRLSRHHHVCAAIMLCQHRCLGDIA